jgi:hypothetical protein
MDFQLTRIEKLPRKVQKDCVFCPKFQACDEVAVIMPLNDAAAAEHLLDLSKIKSTVNGQTIIPLISTRQR